MKYIQGDYVVHPGQGVCQVLGIAERKTIVGASADNPGHEVVRQEYTLAPLSDSRVSIHYPVEKEDALRPIIAASDARELIREAPTLESDTFDKPQTWTVRDHFIGVMREGDCRDAMRVVKTLHERVAHATQSGRKPRACYTKVLDEAKQRLFDELSVSLNVSQDSIEGLIQRSFADAGQVA